MAASTSGKSNPPKPRKRVDADRSGLKRARDGSGFTKCDVCKKDIPVALADMHDCNLDAKAKMNLDIHMEVKAPEPRKPSETKASKRKSPDEKQKKPKREKKEKKEKKTKDPNQPKRPQTAFFIFMEEFRMTFKEANPESKGVAMAAKQGGEKWKAMSEEEKKPYVDKAAEQRAEYEKALSEYQEGLNKAKDDAGEDAKDATDEGAESEAEEE